MQHSSDATRVAGMCRSMGFGDRSDEIVALVERWTGGGRAIEIAAAWGGRGNELRVVVDGAAELPDDARRALAPLAAIGRACLAVSFAAGRPERRSVRVEIAPAGRWRAPAAVEETLAHLGLMRAWPAVIAAAPRGIEREELAWLQLELGPEPHVELAWRHHGVGTDEIAVTRLRFSARDAAAMAHTVERPVTGSEGDVAARISGWLRQRGVNGEPYAAALERQPWSEGVERVIELDGDGAPAIVCRFDARPPRAPAADVDTVVDAEEIVRRYEHDILLANHPFLSRLRREPVNLGHLYVILANFWEAIVHDFPARLAKVIAHLDDDRLRSIFAKQLNDELGEGDYARAHKPMFRTLVGAVEPYRPRIADDVMLAPGRRFGRALEALLFDSDYHVAVGALMMIEIYGKQTDLRMGEEFRRQNQLADDALTWLRLHESLEVDHADDSLRLAHMMPRAAAGPEARAQLAAVWRGARGVVDAGHAYFHDLYRVCYP